MKKLLLGLVVSNLMIIGGVGAQALPPLMVPGTGGKVPANVLPFVPPFTPPSSPLTATFSRGIPLSEFARLVLEDVLRVPFVMAPELLSTPDMVGVSVRGLEKAQALDVLESVLADRGFSMSRGSMYVIRKKKEDEKDVPLNRVLVEYTLKHRKVSALSEQLPGLFPTAYFSFGKRANDGGGADSKQQQTTAQERDDKKDPMDTFFVQVVPAEKDKLLEVLKKLDKPVPQVRVRATLYSVGYSRTEGSGVAVAVSILNDKLKIKAGSPRGTGNAVEIITPYASAVFENLDGDSRFKALATPNLVAINGKKSEMQVGASVPILAGTTEAKDGSSTQSVAYQETGTIMRIKPEIGSEGVLMEVELEISDAVQTTTGVSGSPTLMKQMFKTSATMKRGGVLVVGGLTTEKKVQRNSKGWLWSGSKETEHDQNDLVLVLHLDEETEKQ